MMPHICEFLAENASKLTFIGSNTLRQNIINYIQPNIVCYQIGERYLSNLSFMGTNFLYTDIHVNTKKKTMDIYYDDEGKFEEMQFHVWQGENWQRAEVCDAQRDSKGLWHVKINLNSYNFYEICNIHFYSIKEEKYDFVNGSEFYLTEYDVI